VWGQLDAANQMRAHHRKQFHIAKIIKVLGKFLGQHLLERTLWQGDLKHRVQRGVNPTLGTNRHQQRHPLAAGDTGLVGKNIAVDLNLFQRADQTLVDVNIKLHRAAPCAVRCISQRLLCLLLKTYSNLTLNRTRVGRHQAATGQSDQMLLNMQLLMPA
jgi:hypothetical protein